MIDLSLHNLTPDLVTINNLLGIINNAEAIDLLSKMTEDPDPQVREIVSDFLA